MRSKSRLAAALVALLALAGLAFWFAPPGALRRAPSGPAPSVAEALTGGSVEGFARATAPRPARLHAWKRPARTSVTAKCAR